MLRAAGARPRARGVHADEMQNLHDFEASFSDLNAFGLCHDDRCSRSCSDISCRRLLVLAFTSNNRARDDLPQPV
jgi:hypothetical protein